MHIIMEIPYGKLSNVIYTSFEFHTSTNTKHGLNIAEWGVNFPGMGDQHLLRVTPPMDLVVTFWATLLSSSSGPQIVSEPSLMIREHMQWSVFLCKFPEWRIIRWENHPIQVISHHIWLLNYQNFVRSFKSMKWYRNMLSQLQE